MAARRMRQQSLFGPGELEEHARKQKALSFELDQLNRPSDPLLCWLVRVANLNDVGVAGWGKTISDAAGNARGRWSRAKLGAKPAFFKVYNRPPAGYTMTLHDSGAFTDWSELIEPPPLPPAKEMVRTSTGTVQEWKPQKPAPRTTERYMVGWSGIRLLRRAATVHGASEGELAAIDRLDTFTATEADLRKLAPLAKLAKVVLPKRRG